MEIVFNLGKFLRFIVYRILRGITFYENNRIIFSVSYQFTLYGSLLYLLHASNRVHGEICDRRTIEPLES